MSAKYHMKTHSLLKCGYIVCISALKLGLLIILEGCLKNYEGNQIYINRSNLLTRMPNPTKKYLEHTILAAIFFQFYSPCVDSVSFSS